jgi:hypothetical protein
VKAWIYFARCGTDGPIKIGRAFDPRNRVRDLTIGSPTPLLLLGAVLSERAAEEETEIHERLHKECIRGEWFEAEAALREMFSLRERLVTPESLEDVNEPADDAYGEQFNIRVRSEDVAVWKAAARRADMPLSRWVRIQLNALAEEVLR